MIVHHQQAIDMGALVPGRSDRPALQRFARYVAGAQAAEIAMMEGMLEMAAARGLAPPPHHHPDLPADPPMAGMLSSDEMAALAAASGAEFERLWLTGMIFHHEGGLAMARVQQLQQLAAGRRPAGLDVMVEEIVDVQRAEVGMMTGRLSEWGLAGDAGADARGPAVEVALPAPGETLAAGEDATVYGVAIDDLDVAAARVGVQNLETRQWLRADGSWGAMQPLPAELLRSGPASAAWRFTFTPPTAGRYLLIADVEDAAGNRASARQAETAAR